MSLQPVPVYVETPAPAPEPVEGKKRQMSFSLLDSGIIQADFGPGLEPLTLNPADVPEALQAAAVAEGLISRARQGTSKLADKERTPEALREAVSRAFQNLLAGIWKIERAHGAATAFSIEIEAAFRYRVSRAKAKGEEYLGTIEESAAAFAILTEEQKKQLKALPRFQAEFAQVKAERQAAKAAEALKKADEAEDESPF
jgi:hypothetical protein